MERHPGPDDVLARAFTPQVYQQVMSGKPRFAGAQAALEYFDVPDAETRVETYGDRKQAMVIELIEAGEFNAYPDALRFIIAVKDAGIQVAAASSSKNASLFLRQIRLDTFADEQRLHVRARDRPALTPAGVLRRRHLGPRLRAGQAAPGDLPDRRRGARCAAERMRSSSRTPCPASRRPRRAGWPRSAYPRADDEDLLAAAEPDVLVTSLDDVDLAALREGRLARRAA